MSRGFVGTYSEHGSEGIYQFQCHEDTGELSQVSLFAPLENSKYLALWKDYLFSLYDDGVQGGVAVFDMDGTLLDKCPVEDSGACYLLATEEGIYTSHYHLGSVTKLAFVEEKLSIEKRVIVAEKGGCHQIIPHGDLLYVPCLHLDLITLFRPDLTKVGEITMPKDSGPRHGVFSLEGDYLYLLGELSNEIYAISMADHSIQGQVSILPEGIEQKEGGAALRLSQDGTRLYASSRGKADLVTVVEIEKEQLRVLGSFSGQGRHPRDIVLKEPYLLVANRGTDEVLSFDMNPEYKKINSVSIPAGVSIVLKGNN